MGRKNSPSERERELQNLIAQYEAVKAKNESLYLDGDQLADIADLYASERKFKEAQEVITYGLGLHPGHTDLMVEQAYLFLDLNQPQKYQRGTRTHHRHLLLQRKTTPGRTAAERR